MIFLLGFIVLDGAAEESEGRGHEPQLFTNTADPFAVINRLIPKLQHEMLIVAHARDIVNPQLASASQLIGAALQRETNLYVYTIVTGRLEDFTEESFQRRLALEQNPAFGGRFRYRVLETPISFGCVILDEKHWYIDFPPNPADLGGGAILFENYPEGARIVRSFIHHQWLEPPGITMSLSEAHEKWKAMRGREVATN